MHIQWLIADRHYGTEVTVFDNTSFSFFSDKVLFGEYNIHIALSYENTRIKYKSRTAQSTNKNNNAMIKKYLESSTPDLPSALWEPIILKLHINTQKTRNWLIFYKPSISRISIEASAAPSLAILGCSFIRPSVRCSDVLESASYNNSKKIFKYLQSLWSRSLGCIGTPNYESIWMLPLQLKDQQDWQSRNAASLNITVHVSPASTAQWVIWVRHLQPTTGEITIS